jgi:hypothetical protein
MILKETLIKKLRDRYPDVHPLIFQRSIDHARSEVDLFDILESIPEYPVTWSEDQHCWVNTHDIFLMAQFNENSD